MTLGCGAPPKTRTLTIAAAANLTGTFDEMGREFTQETGVPAVMSYQSTAALAQQIDNGAPFDVFAAADVEHVDALTVSRKLMGETRAIYARGVLALWFPKATTGERLGMQDLAKVRYLAIAQPATAPYGTAAVEALKAAGLWESLQAKVVYANNISQAKQMAASGNADAAFTAASLLLKESGAVVQVDPNLYRPLDQAIAVVAGSAMEPEARQFVAFVMSPRGQAILLRDGYQAVPK